MSAVFQLCTGPEQDIQTLGRHQTGNRNQLRNAVVMRNRLKSFFVKPVRDNADAGRMIRIRCQIIGKSARNRHQPVTYMLKFAVNRNEKLVLQSAFFDYTVKNELALVTGVQRLNQRDLRINLFHGEARYRMVGMDQIILLAHPQLRPPDVIPVGLDIFLHNRTFTVHRPVKRFKDNLFASLVPNPLGQPEQIHIPAAGAEPFLQIRNHGRYATGLLRREE